MTKRQQKALVVAIVGLCATIFGLWQQSARPQVSASPADGFRVLKVVDGDTVEIDYYGQPTKLRLIGLDTPEVVDPRKPVQCYGREASEHAHQLLDGKSIKLESDPLVGETDKYGRKLAYLFLPDGTNFALAMISDGYGHEYTYQSQSYKYQSAFKAAQQVAESAQRGLWSTTTCGGNTR